MMQNPAYSGSDDFGIPGKKAEEGFRDALNVAGFTDYGIPGKMRSIDNQESVRHGSVCSLRQRASNLAKAWTRSEKRKSLRDSFTEDLSISGVKHVCGDASHKLRRCVWVFLILTMIGLLLMTAIQRGLFYATSPTVIYSDKKFCSRIQFPSITICNMNLIRSSASYHLLQHETMPFRRDKHSVYEAITQYFHVLESWTAEGAEQYENKYGDIWQKCYNDSICDDFYSTCGHRKETLIAGCSWRGRPCGPENFTEVHTDLGLCYRWNGGEDYKYIHHAESSGLSGGLQLDLNIEQDEYMKSSREVAGVYAIVQDQSDMFSMIDGHGFAISKGSYVTVGLQKTVHEEHKDPLKEKCNNGQSYDACVNDCYASYLINECKCKDYFMRGKVPICTVEKHLSCLHPKKVEFPSLPNFGSYCGHCKPSCQYTSFDKTISSSPFSNFYADRQAKLLLGNATRIAHNLLELMRIRDWSSLNTVSKNYTNRIYDLSQNFTNIYFELIDNYPEPVATLQSLTSQLENVFNSSSIDFVAFKDSVNHISLTYVAIERYTTNHNLYHYSKQYRLAEDINVRIASDLARRENTVSNFAAFVNLRIDQILMNVSEMEQRWESMMPRCRNNNEKQSTTRNMDDDFFSSSEDKVEQLGSTSATTCEEINDLIISTTADLRHISRRVITEINVSMAIYDVLKLAISINPLIPIPDPYDRNPTLPYELGYTIGQDYYMENYARLQVYFSEMAYSSVVKAKAYDESALISDLGGALGFYLGGSCLTLVELADIFIIKVIAKKWQQRVSKKSTDKVKV